MHQFHQGRCIDRNGLGIDIVGMSDMIYVIIAGGRIIIRIIAYVSRLEEISRIGVEEWILVDRCSTCPLYTSSAAADFTDLF